MKIKIIGILCILAGLSLIIYSSTSILSEDIIKEEAKKENEKIVIEKENVNRSIEEINELEDTKENEEENLNENIVEDETEKEIVINDEQSNEQIENNSEISDELILGVEETE